MSRRWQNLVNTYIILLMINKILQVHLRQDGLSENRACCDDYCRGRLKIAEVPDLLHHFFLENLSALATG